MYLNTISPMKKSNHSSKRKGRGIGSGKGKTSGRGHKGQRSRSGGKVRRGFEGGQMPLYRRLPKFGHNKSKKSFFKKEIKLSEFMKIKDSFIDLIVLKKNKIINSKIKIVKIIFSKNFNKKINIKNLKVSKNAKKEIEFFGGTIN
ncbi:rplO [Wigglesworthia glossinidia endosymbiont of Glossina brevipalpis]|uniref:Large ribosomal subunit protein uL15 n=1 Tax=Wigglesworthia glossinidia brevipalpis TaxID=36870 RepID=RL15_WIGBR|nr:RecName: Full=Large ribosomal subunit protein uL15; AltName: Full=50S ribosomal protein L15 [Wigglesworthia glossinidia endosymbiont of Glossina brevipalpis]BAC24708.1 rplO [Wigglesworthia glossinidia endosymbiont of Glossina brevipalpis]